MKDAGLDHGRAEKAVVQHFLEDFQVAQEGRGGQGVAVGVRSVGIRLQPRHAVWKRRMGRVCGVVMQGWPARSSASRNEHRPASGTRSCERRRRGLASPA